MLVAQGDRTVTQSLAAHSGEIGSERSGVGSLCHKERISSHSRLINDNLQTASLCSDLFSLFYVRHTDLVF